MSFRTSYITALLASALLVFSASYTPDFVYAADALKITGPDGQTRQVLRQYGPTTKSDTFWSIAQKMRPDPKLSIYQVMAAIYDANPHAFSNPNYNSLERGMILLIPSKDVMAGIPKTIAKQRAERDDQGWSTAKVVPKPVIKAKPVVKSNASLNIEQSDVDKPQAKSADSVAEMEQIAKLTARLELSESKNLSLTDSLARAQDQVLVNETDIAAFEIKIEELNEKVSMLEEALQVSKQQNAELELQQAANVQTMDTETATAEEPDDLWRTIVNNPLYLALGAAIPALLLLLLLWGFLRKRQNKDMDAFSKANTDEGVTDTPNDILDGAENDKPESIDDVLDMDNVALNPESNPENAGDDSEGLFVDSAEDEIADLDAHDDEDGQSLDDLWAEAMVDDDDDTSMEGIHLEQTEHEEDDLDALLADLDSDLGQTDIENQLESEQQSNGQEAENDDLDALMAGLELPEEESTPLEDAKDPELESEMAGSVIDEADLDALLADFDSSETDTVSSIELEADKQDNAETVQDDEPEIASQANMEPDDIDALLADLEQPVVAPIETEAPMTDSAPEPLDEQETESSSEDDIDSLLADFGTTPAVEPIETETPITDSAPELLEEQETESSSEDDIDSLLADFGSAPAAEPLIEDDHAETNLDSLLEELESQEPELSIDPPEVIEDTFVPASDVSTDPKPELDQLLQELDSVETPEAKTDDDLNALIAELENGDDDIELNIEEALETIEDNPNSDEATQQESSFFNDLKSSKAVVSAPLDWDLADNADKDNAKGTNDAIVAEPDLDVSDEQLLSAFSESVAEEEVLAVEDEFNVDTDSNLTVEQALAALDDESSATEPSVPEHELASFQQDNGFIDIDKLLNDADEDEAEQDLYKDFDVDVGDVNSLMANTAMVDVDDEENSINAKLDLARAYIEIDDKDSAKALLNEVLLDGNERQKAESSVLIEDMD